MDFRRAWFHLLNGEKIKRPHWGGYWAWENGTIMMHCKDGRVLDIRETKDPAYTFENVAALDWEVMTMTTENVKFSPPWITFLSEIKALFENDPAVRVDYDEKSYTISLLVEDSKKANALARLLPEKKVFGNIEVAILVIPANEPEETTLQLFLDAFEGNPALSYVQAADGIFSFDYVVFRNKVIQFFDDNLADVNRQKSMLYQDIAQHVFGKDLGVFFCTDTAENTGEPLPLQD